MSTDSSELSHGHSPAAWTAVVIMCVAFAIGTLFFCIGIAWVVWASVGLLIVGFIAGVVLAKLGYGVGGARYTPKEH